MNIAIMARVSTQEQAKKGYSIGEQLERMRDYCKAMGWTIYNEYVDAGFSGANTNRPALQKLIRDTKAGKIDKVLVYKLDRLSRSQRDTLELIEDVFLANNTDFVSMSENFDTATPLGKAMIGILAVFAQLEREQIKERMEMGKLARAKSGKYTCCFKIPIGYKMINGELIADEYEKMLVIEAFNLYNSGLSPYAISKRFNEAGKTIRDGKWHPHMIREMLKKRTYLGYIHWKGKWYKGNHEAFISEDLFNSIQETMKRKGEEHQKYNRRAGKANSVLGGYLYCGKCCAKLSKYMTGYYGDKDRKSYYMCYSVSKRSKKMIRSDSCDLRKWKMEELDNLVFDEIRKLALDTDYIATIRESQPDQSIELLGDEIKKLNSQLDKVMRLYEKDEIPLDLIGERIHQITDRKQKLELELERLKQEKDKKISQDNTISLAKSLDDILQNHDLDEIRAIIGALINKVVVYDHDIEIHWNFN